MFHFNNITVNNPNTVKLLTFCNKIGDFNQQLRLIFGYRLFSYKCIFIGAGFDFCTVYKNRFSRNFSKFVKEIRHFSENSFRTRSKMNTAETGKSGMVRNCFSL